MGMAPRLMTLHRLTVCRKHRRPLGSPAPHLRAIAAANPVSLLASLTLLDVTQIALICSVWASMPMCNLRHCRRRSGPCFLHFHSPSPKNLIPVESISRCSPAWLRVYGTCTFKSSWRLHSVLQIWHRPSKPAQVQHRLRKTRGLPQCQAKQVLERQAKLDGCIRELRTASAFATCRGKPAHALVQPNRQRASSFEGCVVLLPVAGSIAGFAGLTHAANLPLEQQRFMQQRQLKLCYSGVEFLRI